jgi:hypothetical protein
MNRKNLFLTVFLIISISVLSTVIAFLLLQKGTVYEVKRVPIELTVSEQNIAGIGIKPGILFFDSVTLGAVSTRKIAFTNQYEKALRALIMVEADNELKTWIFVSKNNFTVLPDETAEVNVTAEIPLNATAGFRNGTLVVAFYSADKQ